MKHYKKTITMLLTAAVLLVSVFMTGCTSLTEPKNSTPSGTDAPSESDGFGVYIKLERDDASSIARHGGSSFTKVCENADGSLLKAGEWIFTGDDIVQLSKKDNCSVLFTVSAHDADDTLLSEGTFLYDVTQEKLYITISESGVTCSTSDAPDAPANENSAADDAWKAAFEKSLLENYGVKPDHYEYLGNGVYQVYVEIDGKVVPYVAVDSATGDYHG